MSDTELEQMFRQWWNENYPTPPSNYMLTSLLSWSRHLLNQAGHQVQRQEVKR